MAELSKKLESKKYVKSSEDQFDARKLLMSPVQTIDDAHSGRSKTSKKSVTGSSKTESVTIIPYNSHHFCKFISEVLFFRKIT